MRRPGGSVASLSGVDKTLMAVLVVIGALLAALLLRAGLSPNARQARAGALSRVPLVGVVSLDGGAETNLSDGVPDCGSGIHTLTFRGRFARDLPAREKVMFRLHHLRMRLYVGGEEAFSFGQTGDMPAFMRSAGSAWHVFESPGIRSADEIVIQLENAYPFTVSNVFAMMLGDVQAGDSGELFRRMFRECGLEIALALMVFTMSVVCVVLAILIRVWRLPGHQRVACFALFSGVVGLGCLLDGCCPYLPLLWPYPGFIITLDMACMFLLPSAALVYIRSYLTGDARRTATRGALMSLVCALAAFSLQLAGVMDLYEMQPVMVVVALALFAEALIRLYRETRGTPGRYALYSFLPALAASLWSAVRFLAHAPGGAAPYRLGLMATVFLQMVAVGAFLRRSAENARRTKELQAELDESRISMLQSQIKPHFLYNTLNAISGMCLTDPIRADDMIIHFSEFLRANMNAMEQTAPIPFEREMAHTKHYVTLERLRFGDRLRVAWDMAFTDFMLPALSLQPIVENAIRHGVAPKPGGGALSISTAREGDDAVIVVTDDGVGYDPASPPDKPGMKGLDNVRKRLAFLSRATLEITSAPGAGTRVVVRVPLNADEQAKEG